MEPLLNKEKKQKKKGTKDSETFGIVREPFWLFIQNNLNSPTNIIRESSIFAATRIGAGVFSASAL
jgi:hypothetical protein